MDSKTKLTDEADIPVGDNQNELTAGSRGPGLLRFIAPTITPE